MTETREQIETRIKELQEKLEKMDKQWPCQWDTYYFINSLGEIYSAAWEGIDCDENSATIGNVFRTEQEALDRVNHIKALVKLRSLVPDGWEPDWSDKEQARICIDFSHSSGCWKINRKFSTELIGHIYFPTEESAQHAIKAMGSQLDDLLKGSW